jgi:transcriptional regulator with XRE-family HTH domain
MMFAARLTALREAAGLSVAQLATAAGLHRQSVHQYENGERRPTWDAVQKLAAALHVPTDTFRDPVK